MKRKLTDLPNFQHTPKAPEINKAKTPEQTTIEVLTAIRQLEPEQQNDVVKTMLAELATDRLNTARQYSDARDRASKNLDDFMCNAVGLEKVLAEKGRQ